MAYQSIEDLDFFRDLERLCDEVWREVMKWPWFDKKAMGLQLVRSLDSVDANLAEGDGRWHWRDQLKHFYIARGSLLEARRWLVKSMNRGLLLETRAEGFIRTTESVHRRLNGVISYRRRLMNQSPNHRVS